MSKSKKPVRKKPRSSSVPYDRRKPKAAEFLFVFYQLMEEFRQQLIADPEGFGKLSGNFAAANGLAQIDHTLLEKVKRPEVPNFECSRALRAIEPDEVATRCINLLQDLGAGNLQNKAMAKIVDWLKLFNEKRVEGLSHEMEDRKIQLDRAQSNQKDLRNILQGNYSNI